MKEILPPTVKKACSFERIFFLEEAMPIPRKKTLGKLILPAVLKSIDEDTDNTVSYIPNTAETSFYGLVEAQDFLNQRKNNFILQNRNSLTKESLQELLSVKIRTEKSSIKDAKLRTLLPKIVVGMI
jgi:amidophosphoribosyltransferase